MISLSFILLLCFFSQVRASLLEDVAVEVHDRTRPWLAQIFGSSLSKEDLMAHLETVSTPTFTPTFAPTFEPTAPPTVSPTASPSATPSKTPTAVPSAAPTAAPSASPSAIPTAAPSAIPTAMPTFMPTAMPTATPTAAPTATPSAAPTTPSGGGSSAAPTYTPTRSPTTSRPSASPTAGPTQQTSTIVVMNSDFTLGNMNTNTLDSAAQNALVLSTAKTLNVSSNSVTYVSSSVLSSSKRQTRRQLRDKDGLGGVRLLTTYQLLATVQISVLTSSYNTTNATAVFQQLQSTLVTAVDNGQFQTTLQSTATSTGATSLSTATVPSVSVQLEAVIPPSTDEDSGDDDGLTDGEIAAVVICSFVGFLLLLAGLYYVLIGNFATSPLGQQQQRKTAAAPEEQGVLLGVQH